jgi:hypothetical protein
VKFRTDMRLSPTRTAWIATHDDSAGDKVLFAQYILTPLLKANDLFDPDSPPEELQMLELQQINRLLHTYVDSINSMPDLPIPKLTIVSGFRLEKLQADWAQRQAAVLTVKKGLDDWHAKYGHILQGQPFQKPDYYDHCVCNVIRKRNDSPEQWQEIKSPIERAEAKKEYFVFYRQRIDSITEEKDFYLADHEVSDFDDGNERYVTASEDSGVEDGDVEGYNDEEDESDEEEGEIRVGGEVVNC